MIYRVVYECILHEWAQGVLGRKVSVKKVEEVLTISRSEENQDLFIKTSFWLSTLFTTFFRSPPPPPEKYRFMIKILMWWTQRPLTFCSSTWLIGCFKCSVSYISQEKWQCFYAVFTMGVCGDGTFPFPPPLIFLIFLTCFRVMQSGEYLRGKRAVSIALDELVLVLLKAYKLTGVALDSD